MSTATAGRRREHHVRDHLADHGWLLVVRAAGSKGPADLVVVHPARGLALVQVGTPSKALTPAERARLCDVADLCSALPVLARVLPGVGVRYWLVTRDTARRWETWTP